MSSRWPSWATTRTRTRRSDAKIRRRQTLTGGKGELRGISEWIEGDAVAEVLELFGSTGFRGGRLVRGVVHSEVDAFVRQALAECKVRANSLE